MTSRANPPHGWSPEMAASPFALVTPIYWGQMWSAATTEFTADHSRQKVGAFFLHFPGFSSAPTWLCTPGRPLIYSTVLAACSFGPRPSLIAPSPPTDQWERPPTVFASRCGATPTMVSNWPLGNTLPSGRLHEVGELKFGSGAVMGAY